jgi:hypothetical protein
LFEFMMLPEEDLWTEVIALSLRDLTNPKSPKLCSGGGSGLVFVRESRNWQL